MSQLNPILGSIVQTPMAQRTQEMDKSRQIRLAQDARKKNAAASGEEEVEESVSSPDELPAVGDEHHNRQNRKNTYTRHPAPEPETDDEGDGLDLTA
jgi:hypothetical protein